MAARVNIALTTTGYGFVDFDCPAAALKAVHALKTSGIQAQMAKVRETSVCRVCVCVCILLAPWGCSSLTCACVRAELISRISSDCSYDLS